jgi:hypothetical protein
LIRRPAVPALALVVLLLGLTLLLPQTANVYHVRVDGSDGSCDGLADRPASSGNPCALLSVQAGINKIALPSCNQGSDLVIHAGAYNGRVSIPSCRQTSGSERTVIEGDPNVPRTSIIIDGGAADEETIDSIGGNNSSTRSTRLTFRHMNIRPGQQAGILLRGEHDDVVIEDILWDTMPDLCCGRDASPFPAALVAAPLTEAITVRDTVAIGNNNITLSGVPGTDAQFVWAGGLAALSKASYVQRNVVTDMLGSFTGGNWTQGIVEGNHVKNSACHGDDGGMQGYNSVDWTIRRNVFEAFYCDGDGNGFGDAWITVRTTCPSDIVGCPPNQPVHHTANALVYNNIFIGRAGAPRNHRRNAFQLRTDGSPAWYNVDSKSSTFWNNIVITNNGKNVEFGRIHPVQFNKCPTLGIVVDYNLWFNNALSTAGVADTGANFFASSATCPGPYNTHSLFNLDPQLDASFAPVAGSRSCSGASTFINPVDGDVSDPWMGALQGACAGGAPPRPPGSIGRHPMISLLLGLRRPEELALFPIPAGEAVVWEEKQ